MENKILSEEDRKRIKEVLLPEIFDFLVAMYGEVSREEAYKCYLEEKMDAVNTDINCINSILEK